MQGNPILSPQHSITEILPESGIDFKILGVNPDQSVDYKVAVATPPPGIDYKMHIVPVQGQLPHITGKLGIAPPEVPPLGLKPEKPAME